MIITTRASTPAEASSALRLFSEATARLKSSRWASTTSSRLAGAERRERALLLLFEGDGEGDESDGGDNGSFSV